MSLLVTRLPCLRDGQDSATFHALLARAPPAERQFEPSCCCVLPYPTQADVASAQQQLSDMQAQCGVLTSERTALQQQLAEAGSGAGKLREQLQHAQAEAAQLQKDADSSAREASSLRSQLSQQVSAMQELQQAASGSGKELQVGCCAVTVLPSKCPHLTACLQTAASSVGHPHTHTHAAHLWGSHECALLV